jgi:hypothetical protein
VHSHKKSLYYKGGKREYLKDKINELETSLCEEYYLLDVILCDLAEVY